MFEIFDLSSAGYNTNMKFESFPTAEPEREQPPTEETAAETNRPETEDEKKRRERVDEISKEETEKKKQEMLPAVAQGLGDLFELLPKDRGATTEDIVKLIEHTELQAMLPGMREKFARELIGKGIHRIEDKARFIGESLDTDTIKMFVHLEGLKAASGNVLERLSEEREGMPQEKAQQEETQQVEAQQEETPPEESK